MSKIYYSDGAFCVDILNGGTPLHAFLSEQLEIISSIYENPELVEGLDEN
ncbi:TPA: YopX family protein [Streptococcus suis]